MGGAPGGKQGHSVNQQVPKVIGVEEVTDALTPIQTPQVVVLVQGWGEADQWGAARQRGQELVLGLLQKWVRQLQHAVSGLQGDKAWLWRKLWGWLQDPLGTQHWCCRQTDKGHTWTWCPKPLVRPQGLRIAFLPSG